METPSQQEQTIKERQDVISAINPDYSQFTLNSIPLDTLRKATSRFFLDTNTAMNKHSVIGALESNIRSFQELLELVEDKADSPDFDFLRDAITSTERDISQQMEEYAPAIVASYEIGQRLEAIVDRVLLFPHELSQQELEDYLESFTNIYDSNSYRDISLKLKLKITIESLKSKSLLPKEFSLESEQQLKGKREWEILPDFYKIDDILSPTAKKKALLPDSVVSVKQRIHGDPAMLDDELTAITANSNLYVCQHEAVASVAAKRTTPQTHPIDLLKSKELLPDQNIWSEYWSHHNQIYLGKLDRLTQLPEETRLRFQGKKAIVTIASMNEANLAQTIQSVADSYGEGFEEEVTILVYNNYKANKPISAEATAALEIARGLSNVVVIDDEVPQYNNTGMAKKQLRIWLCVYSEKIK